MSLALASLHQYPGHLNTDITSLIWYEQIFQPSIIQMSLASASLNNIFFSIAYITRNDTHFKKL